MDGRVEEMASKMSGVYAEKKAACAVHAEECGCGASDAAHAQLQIKTATNTHVWRAFWTLLRVSVCVHPHIACCLGGSPSCACPESVAGPQRSVCSHNYILLQFRGVKDYSDPSFIIPRVSDKLFVAFLMTTLYWGLGHRKTSTNVNNITALLFMWATLPGFTAVAYVPAIVLDKPLFRRQVQ